MATVYRARVGLDYKDTTRYEVGETIEQLDPETAKDLLAIDAIELVVDDKGTA